MSVWVELHCDVRASKPTPTGTCSCESDAGKVGGHMAKNNSLASMSRALDACESDARERGWVKKSGKWTCKGCQ